MSDNVISVSVGDAPVEVHAYLERLIKACNWKGTILVGTIPADVFPTQVGVTKNPNGFLRVRQDGPPIIILPDNILEDDRWRSVVAHELLHAIRWDIDQFVLERLPEAEHELYMHRVEEVMKPLTILLMVGGHIQAEWVETEHPQ